MIPALPTRSDWIEWGVDPSWSRVVEVPERGGAPRRWHVLDTGPPSHGGAGPTVLCVHGNPTWSYVWTPLLHRLAGRHRVVAVDQLGMGYSERTAQRRYADRVADLDDLVRALGLADGGPIVVAGHDWGGAIAMGWAVDHREELAALVLCNTGIAVPEGRSAPALIRAAASPFLLDAVCRGTPLFVEGASRLSRRRLSAVQRAALRAPYRAAPQRAAIADFVADIPLRADAASAATIAAVADRLGSIDAPVLLAWGPDDPVFDDSFAEDLASRMPHVDRHRFPRGGHLVTLEDVGTPSAATVICDWLVDLPTRDRESRGSLASGATILQKNGERLERPLWVAVEERAADPDTADQLAVVDVAGDEAVTWRDLRERVEAGACELVRRGVRPGDRVAVLTPPSIDLLVVAYAIVRSGGVAVVADRGLGLRGLRRALRSTRPRLAVGPRPARVAARSMRWTPGAELIDPGDLGRAVDASLLPSLASDDPAAVLFTSGATGPAKGVRYTHGQLAAQRDALGGLYGITRSDRLVAAFAPFALYGPGLGIATALPDCDVTAPGDLTASALDDACRQIDATLVFASPAALANVVATADGAFDGVAALRLVLSAGAPVPAELLRAVAKLAPTAELHTPYGMTEVLPAADNDLDGIETADRDDPTGGVCVGAPVDGARVRIVPLGFDAAQPLGRCPTGDTGEILVDAPWVSAGYLGLWATERAARSVDESGTVWHRSGDVGHLDAAGRLWVEGRSVHVVAGPDGPITPVPVERVVERLLDGERVAAVGIGPTGRQQLVVVVEREGATPGLASGDLSASVRRAVEPLGHPVAAVLVVGQLPVDIRHNAKIDRAAVGGWASRLLAGRRAKPTWG